MLMKSNTHDHIEEDEKGTGNKGTYQTQKEIQELWYREANGHIWWTRDSSSTGMTDAENTLEEIQQGEGISSGEKWDSSW